MFVSEFGQERVALEILGNKRNGTFVDIGATDGLTRNNSWTMESHFGWTGVCVEPVLSFFTALRKNRARAIRTCIGNYSQMGAILFREDDGNAEISKIDPRGELTPCITLNHLLEAAGMREVDYLSVDTEGNELNILSAVDFDRFDIQVIDFEHNDHWGPEQKANKAAIHGLLTVRGYLHHSDIGVDSIYVKKNV